MTDAARAWIEERRKARVPNSTLSVSDAHNNLPRALDALNKVLELIEFMEADAVRSAVDGHRDASDVLLEAAGDLRQAIEGAINGERG